MNGCGGCLGSLPPQPRPHQLAELAPDGTRASPGLGSFKAQRPELMRAREPERKPMEQMPLGLIPQAAVAKVSMHLRGWQHLTVKGSEIRNPTIDVDHRFASP